MPNIELDYERAQNRLKTVFPDDVRGANTYNVSTRLEGTVAVSRLIHTRTGHAVGHVQWDNDTGRIRSFDIDPEHRMVGFNLGRLLKGSWRDSEALGVAGPVHGLLGDKGDVLRNKLTEDSPEVSDSVNHFTENPGGVVGVDTHLITNAIRNQNSVERPPLGAVPQPMTQDEKWNFAYSHLRTVASSLENADNIIRSVEQVRNRISALPERQDRSVLESSARFTEVKQNELNRLSNYAVEDRREAPPVISVETGGRSFSTEIGRAPETTFATGARGVDCKLCNDAGTHLLVGKIPMLPAMGEETAAQRIHRSVLAHAENQVNMTVSSNLVGRRRTVGASTPNVGEVGSPLAHHTITVQPKNISRNAAIFASPESSSSGRSILIRVPVTCGHSVY
jgi:hypothetical protein